MLDESQAVEIYQHKISIMVYCSQMLSRATSIDKFLRGKSNPIAVRFGVTSRTVRDIWNRKTWAYASQHLWALETHVSDNSMTSKLPSSQVSTSSDIYGTLNGSRAAAQNSIYVR